jgi:glycosyltransferase involved in cell wall biosynthesis
VRIGLLTTSYPRYDGDYAGSFVADRVAQLLDDGHRVDVVAAADATSPAGPRLLGERLTVVRLPAGAGLFYGGGAPEALEAGGGAAWLSALAFFSALAAEARARAPAWDLVESHWLVPGAAAASAGAPRLPRRAWAHSGDVALLQRLPGGRAIARRLAADGTDLRFVTAELRERFAGLVGRSVGRVEALPVSASLFAGRRGRDRQARDRLGLSGPTVLAVGRLVPIKGHARLLRAAALAAPDRDAPRPQIVILGDGPERDRLEELARRLRVPLRLPGFVPRAEVADWLRAADLFVLPSVALANGRTEGAPTSLREAAAVGIPCVATADLAELARAIGALRLT